MIVTSCVVVGAVVVVASLAEFEAVPASSVVACVALPVPPVGSVAVTGVVVASVWPAVAEAVARPSSPQPTSPKSAKIPPTQERVETIDDQAITTASESVDPCIRPQRVPPTRAQHQIDYS
ncbi:hypothetical protein [Nannocystis punicea]|uniref:Secreted protein n=1 Tax=Nannocystis punicea TaxID=2995304 RepID=A0ABY7H9B8_9BACT|nr:hypothetical protein [Nannocystis poenicansa]WAS95858.1 hypothetical protein O0S08_06815 [Nannocystis poenicansa]